MQIPNSMLDFSMFDSTALFTTVVFLLFKIGMLLIATAFAGQLILAHDRRRPRDPVIGGAIAALLVVAFDLVFNSANGFTTTLLRVNSQSLHLAVAVVGGLCVWRYQRPALLAVGQRLQSSFAQASWPCHLAPLIIFIAVLKPLIACIGAVYEGDSLEVAGAMMGWLQNTRSPYELYTYYISTWESTYVPTFAVTNISHLYWTISLEADVLVFLAAHALARILKLPRLLSLLMASAVMLIFLNWLRQPTGIATLKPDMAFCASGLLIAVALILSARQGINRMNAVLFALGGAFIMTKYHGTILYSGATLLYLGLGGANLRTTNLKDLARALWPAVLILALPLQHYLYNIIVHHNLFFPLEMKIGPWTMEGDMKAAGFVNTSLWYERHLPEAQDLLLIGERRSLTNMGLLWIPTMIVPFLVVLIYGVERIRRLAMNTYSQWAQREWYAEHFCLFAFAALGLLVYYTAPLSASAAAGTHDLIYLRGVMSSRYALPAIGVAEIAMVALIYAWGRWGRMIATFLILAHLGVRLDILLDKMGYEPTTLPIVRGAQIVVLAILGLAFWKGRFRGTAIGLGACGILLILFATPLADFNRTLGNNEVKAADMRLANLPPQTVFLIQNKNDDPVFGHRFHTYQLRGARFQHTLVHGTFDELKDMLARNGAVWPTIAYSSTLVLLDKPREEYPKALAPYGYLLTSGSSGRSVIFEHVTEVATLPLDEPIQKCDEIECGDIRMKDWGWSGWDTHRLPHRRPFLWQANDATGYQVYWRGDGLLYRYEPPNGTTIQVRGAGKHATFSSYTRDNHGMWREAQH